MKTIIGVLISIISFTGLFAQDLATDLEKVREMFKNGDNILMEMEVYLLHDNTSKELLGKAEMQKAGMNYHSKFLHQESISNGQVALVIDHDAQTIDYYDAISEEVYQSQFDPGNIVDAISELDTIVYRRKANGDNEYTLYPKGGEIDKMILLIDTKQHTLKLFEYWYKANPSIDYGAAGVQIVYKKTETPKIFPSEVFSIEEFILQSKDQVTLTDKYNHYELFIPNDTDYDDLF